MGVFLAILADTWRQSKQQIVFPLLLGVMGLFSLAWVLLCDVAPTPDGTYVATFAFRRGEPEMGYEVFWDGMYKNALVGEKSTAALRGPGAELQKAKTDAERAAQRLAQARLRQAPPEVEAPIAQEFEAARKELEAKAKAYEAVAKQLDDEATALMEQRAPGISALHKGVQVWMSLGVWVLVYLAILGFIAAGSGYFPAMLQAGAVDIIVSKPLPRWKIFFGKYFAGLGLMGAAVLASLLVLFVGLGFKTGIWHVRLFAAAPVLVFVVALMYAVVLCVGVVTRSTPFAIVIGYIYYVVVEVGIWALQNADGWLSAMGAHYATITTLSEAMKWTFPGFWRLNVAAAAAVLNVPGFDWQPLLVGSVWIIVLLGAAYAWFERTDF